ILFNSSGLSPSLTSTSKPSAFLNTSRPSGASESVTKIFIVRSTVGLLVEDRGLKIEDGKSRVILDPAFSILGFKPAPPSKLLPPLRRRGRRESRRRIF